MFASPFPIESILYELAIHTDSVRLVRDEQTGAHCGSISVEVYVPSVTVVIVTFSGHKIIYIIAVNEQSSGYVASNRHVRWNKLSAVHLGRKINHNLWGS